MDRSSITCLAGSLRRIESFPTPLPLSSMGDTWLISMGAAIETVAE